MLGHTAVAAAAVPPCPSSLSPIPLLPPALVLSPMLVAAPHLRRELSIGGILHYGYSLLQSLMN